MKFGQSVLVSTLSARRRELVRRALGAKLRSYSPYSHYAVGSALRDDRGKIHTGCNVENVAWSTICAERSALVKMISRGGKACVEIVVAASGTEPNFPCGVCLQFLIELGSEATVIAVDGDGKYARVARMSQLLPYGFSNKVWKKT